jgi:hypothetical protein
MIMMITFTISILLNIVLIFSLFRLAKKVESMDSIIQEYNTFFDTLLENVEQINFAIKRIDLNGSFETDDEVGIIYTTIRNMVLTLRQFFDTTETVDAEKKE